MFALDWRTYVRQVHRRPARRPRRLGSRGALVRRSRPASALHGETVRHALVDRELALRWRSAGSDLPAGRAQRSRGRRSAARSKARTALNSGDVDAFAVEQAPAGVPRKEDDDGELEALSARR